ncbi:hypothetical protein INT47_000175 [Mucor saturninus]|uniref:No apical meristem-associated C-terminal domain-containing protein n=1 Tax=Mucor saturninus TaxID=64648 RepID=A0A8H7QJF9_9FUNG|nr:hypothetical protein INT47_000175 [Mucor saturninus]
MSTETNELINIAFFQKQADEAEKSHNGQVPLHYPASSSSGNESIDTSKDAESSDANPKKKRKISKASLKTKSKKGVHKAYDIYKTSTKNGAPFVLEHCWQILFAEPKWAMYNKPKPVVTKRKNNGSLEVIEDTEADSSSGDVARPMECKKLKALESRARQNEVGESIAARLKDLLELNEKKLQYVDDFEDLVNSTGTYSRCASCNVAMVGTKSEFQLRGEVRTRAERTAFNMWLKTRKIPDNDQPPELSPKDNGKKLASVDQLLNLCQESQFKCVITGSQIAFHDKHQNRYPYWAFSIDHKVPLSHWKNDPNAWTIGNLQAMAGSINAIKGDLSDDEVKRWYHQYFKSNC